MGNQTAAPRQFFRRSDTREAISRLAAERRLTILVGAGASAEAGLPLWSELVERLLLRALSPSTSAGSLDYPEDIVLAARRALRDGGALGAATMARAALGDRFNEELRVCLYEWPHKWQWNLPGSTARAVAKLFAVMERHGQTCEIATTNYDIKLEEALEDVLEEKVVSSCRDSEDPDGHPVVRHLHGVLTEDGCAEEVTLTEADYHAVDASGLPWQESYLRRRFEDSTVVFIGASLTDQHLLRYIFRYAEEKPRPVALLVEDLETLNPVDQPRLPDSVDELLAPLKHGRWEYVHLTALQADFRAQPAQFLHEVAHQGFNRRDPLWRAPGCLVSRNRRRPLGPEFPRDLRHFAVPLSGNHRRWLDTVVNQLEDAGYDLSEETLAVHLWCRAPDRLYSADDLDRDHVELTSLAMMGCSDRTWNDPRAMDVRLVTQPSSRAAVDAFCWGTPQVQLPQGRPKWHWILATPVVLEEHPTFGRLPVGAVTLVSDRDLKESVLGRLRAENPELLGWIERYLAAAAEGALTP